MTARLAPRELLLSLDDARDRAFWRLEEFLRENLERLGNVLLVNKHVHSSCLARASPHLIAL
jgi:hypothetical protein